MDHLLRRRGIHAQSGLTLVEAMIALGIGIVIALGVSSVYLHVNKSSMAHTARISADQEMAQIVATLNKDMDYLNQNGVCQTQGGNCATQWAVSQDSTTFTINNGINVRSYTSQCVNAPPSLSSVNFTAAVQFGCLPATVCPQGQMPSLTLIRPAPPAGGPVVTQVFPLFLGSGQVGIEQKSVGTMACFSQTGNGISVEIATFYVGANSSTLNTVSALTRHLSFAFGNVASAVIINGN